MDTTTLRIHVTASKTVIYFNLFSRKYAVTRLRPLSDPDLELYLLYLVRALRFENFDAVKDGLHAQLVDFFEVQDEEAEDKDPNEVIHECTKVVEEEEEEEEEVSESEALLPLRRPESCPDLTSPTFKKGGRRIKFLLLKQQG